MWPQNGWLQSRKEQTWPKFVGDTPTSIGIRPLEVSSVWAQAGQGRLQATADLVSEAADYCRCWSTNIHQWNHLNTFFPRKIDLFCSIPIDGTCLHYHPLAPSASFYECGPTPFGQAELDVHTAIVEEYAQDAGSTVKSGMGKEKQERFSTVAIDRTASWLNGNLLREPGAGSYASECHHHFHHEPCSSEVAFFYDSSNEYT